MVAFSFKAQFADLVERREKRQTIRASARCKVGDRIQLYTGMRTKDCRKLVADDPICTDVDYCALRPGYITFDDKDRHPFAVDERQPVLFGQDSDDFARADGFKNYADMLAWFTATYGSPYFTGVVIKWDWPDKEGGR